MQKKPAVRAFHGSDRKIFAYFAGSAQRMNRKLQTVFGYGMKGPLAFVRTHWACVRATNISQKLHKPIDSKSNVFSRER